MILGDRDLKYYLEKGWIIIDPLNPDSIRENGIDLRVGNQVARFNEIDEVYDSTQDISKFYTVENGNEFIINPHEHVLFTTLERIILPNDVMAFVNLRSSFARLGLLIPPTIVDAGFHGELTIEIFGSSFPIKIKTGTRFIHLIFAKTLTPVENPYHGNYQGQVGVKLSQKI